MQAARAEEWPVALFTLTDCTFKSNTMHQTNNIITLLLNTIIITAIAGAVVVAVSVMRATASIQTLFS